MRRDLRLRSPRVGGQGRHVNRAAHRETAVNGPEGARGTGEVETKCPAAVYCQKRHRCQEPVANSKSQEESEGTRLSHRGRTLCFFCIYINVQAYVYASQLDFYYSSFKVFLPLFYFTFASLLLFLTFSFKSESKVRGETQEATPLGGHPRPRLSHSWVHQGAPLCTRPSSRARAETPQPNEDAAASGGLRHPSPCAVAVACIHEAPCAKRPLFLGPYPKFLGTWQPLCKHLSIKLGFSPGNREIKCSPIHWRLPGNLRKKHQNPRTAARNDPAPNRAEF